MSVETMPFLAMLRRMIAAAGRRVGDADEYELRELVGLRVDLEKAIARAVAGQRATGRSWSDIALALGMTRQSAHEHWGAGS